jgi:signal transduction histidine kinase
MADPAPGPDGGAAEGDPATARLIHELRTPTTIARGRAQLLRLRWRRGTLDEDGLEAGVQAIEAATVRLEALARQLERGE